MTSSSFADCGDALVIKMDDDNCMIEHIVCNGSSSQNWGVLATRVANLMSTHHPTKALVAYALTDANTIDASLIAASKGVDDCDVTLKSSIPAGNTAMPPSGVTLSSMADDDFVVSCPS